RWRVETETRLLADFGLPLNRRISALSKGMRTKVGLLLNLSRHAEFLILDEPSEGLDPVMAEQMLLSLVQQAVDGTTIFFSSHQVAEVEQIADHIIAIEKGRVILDGSLDDLRQKFRRVNLVFDDPPPPEACGWGCGLYLIPSGQQNEVVSLSCSERCSSIFGCCAYPCAGGSGHGSAVRW